MPQMKETILLCVDSSIRKIAPRQTYLCPQGPYDATNLLNCCLGLLIVRSRKMSCGISRYS
jgi:hypothetical protein